MIFRSSEEAIKVWKGLSTGNRFQPSFQAPRVGLQFPKKSSRETNVDLSPLKIQKVDTQQSEIWKLRLGIETLPKSEPHDMGHELCYQNRDTASR